MTRFLRIQFFFCFVASACTPSGPPFPPPNALKVPDAMTGVPYMLYSDVPFYRKAQVSELVFEPCSRESCFRMRFAGVNPSGSIRVRSYEGRAYWKDYVELRPDRCYEFAKRSFEDRLTPVEGWDCDHLVFQFHPVENTQGPGLMVSRPGEYTVHSDWLGTLQAVPLPQAYFAGQVLPVEGEPRTIVFGANAGKKLRDKQILEAWQIESAPLGKAPAADRRTGQLEVLERPGDFVLTTWKGPPGQANVVILREAPPAKSIFD
jgi:hypothetical protein